MLVVIFTPGGIYTFRHPFRAVRNARFARVTGEVFLVDSNGKVPAADGAWVSFYKADSKHNSSTFSESDLSRPKKWWDKDWGLRPQTPPTFRLRRELAENGATRATCTPVDGSVQVLG